MKLKCQAVDFEVRERCNLPLAGGQFAVYELTKRSLGTWEAVNALAQRWGIPHQAIVFAGLKDKHAATRQTITIHRGPRKQLTQSNFEVRYLGQASRAVKSTDIEANEFRVVVRDLSAEQLRQGMADLPVVEESGLPNYFDDQRFGSLGESREFIARPWCLGNWERTVWLMIADGNERDAPDEQEQKRLLRTHWGAWQAVLSAVRRSPWRHVVEYLCDRPDDFRGAIACVSQELRSMYLAAYQSDLWNGMLSAAVERAAADPKRLTHVEVGRRKVAFDLGPANNLRGGSLPQSLPLPSARLHDLSPDTAALLAQVLPAEGLELRQLRVKYPRDSFFSKGDRLSLVRPAEMRCAAGDDELYSGRQKMVLQFSLPRAAYATVVVKRLFLKTDGGTA